jgi:hypothetical protein
VIALVVGDNTNNGVKYPVAVPAATFGRIVVSDNTNNGELGNRKSTLWLFLLQHSDG